MREKNGKLLLTFVSEDEEGNDWVEGDGHLSSLISVRAELGRGDLRGLYLGWLLCAQAGDFDVDELEPPVPAGLGQLSASLEGLVDFLRVDTDLVGIAATTSPPLLGAEPKPAEVQDWLATLPAPEKDDLLARLIAGSDGVLANELGQRMSRGRDRKALAKRRTVAELLRAAGQAAGERRRVAAEKTAKEKVRREREAARARAKHLAQLAGKEPMLWEKVDGLIATKQPKNYDQAVEWLVDLRELAALEGGADFRRRVEALRHAHARKPTLIERLHKAGL